MSAGGADVVVRHYCAGGRENGGGIGRLIGYVIDAARVRGARHAIVDTRGPRWDWILSPALLLVALATMASDRLLAPGRIHHIHIAGRGSTMRKLILCGMARLLGCAHLLHLHDYDYAHDFVRRPAWIRHQIRAAFGGANAVFVLGQRDHDTVRDLLGVPADRITILRNCVPDPGPRPSRPDAPVVILFLGQLGPRKGVPELLEALADPRLSTLAWQAVFAGDGAVEHYRARAITLGLAGRIAMPGWLDEAATRALCARADVLALPSHGEGMAMAVLEGLAHQLAVVTTEVGAHGEAIRHGIDGIFVPVGDISALAEALIRLISDRTAREAIAARGRALYRDRFSMEAYMPRLNDIYDTLPSPRRVSGAREHRRA